MDGIQQIGIDLILWLQQFSPTFDGVMRGLSALGAETFYTLVLTFAYWCIDIHLGVRIAVLLVASNYVNTLAKWLFHAPRPYWVDGQVQAIAAESSYGAPSGHAQNAAAVWGGVALWFKSRWVWLAAGLLTLAISLSRLYLGVHFLHDVLLGWLLGVIVLIVYLRLEQPVGRWLSAQSLGKQTATALGISLLMVGLGLLTQAVLSGITDPPAWSEQAALALSTTADQPAIDPRNREGLFSMAGTIFGLIVGVGLMRRYAPFSAAGVWWKRIVRFVLGLIVVVVLQVGLAALFPSEPEWIALLLRSVRYAALMLWAVWLAPWVFLRLGLAERR